MSKHTPGPWNIDPTTVTVLQITTEDESPICIVDCESEILEWGMRAAPNGRDLANANLIAAAPKLPEALKKCVEALPVAGDSDLQDMARLVGLEAISKAEGKA